MKKTMLLCTLLLAACAKPPEDIVPAVVPHSSYSDRTCVELASLAASKRSDLVELGVGQRAAAKEDKDSMSAIHIPVGTIRGGDREPDVAREGRGPCDLGSAPRQGMCSVLLIRHGDISTRHICTVDPGRMP